jgi:hypothetical protein
LNIPAFTLAFGILWGSAVFFLTWWLIALDADPGTLGFLQTAIWDTRFHPWEALSAWHGALSTAPSVEPYLLGFTIYSSTDLPPAAS